MAGSGQPKTQVITSPQAEYDELRHVSAETPCPYLPGRMSRIEAYSLSDWDGGLYESLMSRGFRRSGGILYRPRCRGCDACRPLRVLTDRFEWTRSLRRVWRKNADVTVETGDPESDAEKHELYRRYLDSQHDEAMSRSLDCFNAFLCESPADTVEFRYRIGRRLIGISVLDRCPGGLSSVYMYFDPKDAPRSPGTFSALWEIDFCRREGMPYYYLGYFVEQSRKMAYKARFRPCEILATDGEWRPAGNGT